MRMNHVLAAISTVAFLVITPIYVRAGDSAIPAIDVSLVAPTDFLAIVIHPRRIAQSPLVAEHLKDEMIAEAIIKNFGIDPSEVERIVVLISVGKDRSGRPEPLPVVIVRFTHNVDAKGAPDQS